MNRSTALALADSNKFDAPLQVDVEPLGSFTEAWKPNEPDRLAPVQVERVSLRDALAARRGLSLQNMLGSIELVEPTFQVQRFCPASLI